MRATSRTIETVNTLIPIEDNVAAKAVGHPATFYETALCGLSSIDTGHISIGANSTNPPVCHLFARGLGGLLKEVTREDRNRVDRVNNIQNIKSSSQNSDLIRCPFVGAQTMESAGITQAQPTSIASANSRENGAVRSQHVMPHLSEAISTGTGTLSLEWIRSRRDSQI